NLRNIGAASCAAERGAFPDASRDQLEWPRRDLLTRAGDADDDAHAPAFVAAFQRLTHGLHIADAFEAVIRTAAGERDQMGNEIAGYLIRVHEIRHAEFLRQRAPCRIKIDADNLRRAHHPRALDDVQSDAAETEHYDARAGLDLCRVDDGADAGW